MQSKHVFPLILLGAVAFISHCAAEDAASAFQSRVLPVLKSNCAKCHGTEKQKAKINLDGARTSEQLLADRDLWYRVLEQIEFGAMPPDEEKQPSDAERKAVAAWVRGEYTALVTAQQRKEGRSKLRRLSRTEYVNTVEDIFGIRPLAEVTLPPDGRVDGYDKVSAALPLTSDGTIGYLTLAEDLLNRWMLKPIPKPKAPVAGETVSPEASRTVRAVARESEQSKGHILELPDGTMVSFNSDTTSGPVKYPGCKIPGIHRIRVSVYGYQTDKPLPFGIYVGSTGNYPQQLELAGILEAPPGKATVLETDIYLKAGAGIRLVPLGIGVQVPKNNQASKCKGPGLAVQWLEDVQPEKPLPGERWLLADFPKALADEIRNSQYGKVVLKKMKTAQRADVLTAMQTTFARIGARLYRRDLSGPELSQLMGDVSRQIDEGVSFESVIFGQVTDMMTSPEFLCVIEQPGKLSAFALASRLSYFLWNSGPDEALLDLARKGQLHDPKVLREQTERLLKDAKSIRFVNDFTSQWLGLHAIDDTSPDSKLYPGYGEYLKLSSVMETQSFFGQILNENMSVRHFVDSPWALVNEPLAKHYGLPEVSGSQLRKVTLPEASPYGGIWTQPAVLKVTANGTNTSPVKRGVWVSKRLLGIQIPPPPPNIEPVDPDIRGAKTLREQLARHSNDASCAACHAKFDPYGFALESFDVTGAFRKNYRELNPAVAALPAQERKGRPLWHDGLPVDCSGKTPGGQAFSGIAELRKALAKNPEQLAVGVVHHLTTYATGVAPTGVDKAAIDAIVKSAAADDYGLRSLVHALVQSELFQYK